MLTVIDFMTIKKRKCFKFILENGIEYLLDYKYFLKNFSLSLSLSLSLSFLLRGENNE